MSSKKPKASTTSLLERLKVSLDAPLATADTDAAPEEEIDSEPLSAHPKVNVDKEKARKFMKAFKGQS